MEIDVKEKTAHNASVGADAGQSIQKDSDNSIPASEAKGNGEMENLEEMYRKMQRMAKLVAQGLVSRTIGERLGISPRTAELHRSHAMKKLSAANPEQLRNILKSAGVL